MTAQTLKRLNSQDKEKKATRLTFILVPWEGKTKIIPQGDTSINSSLTVLNLQCWSN